MRSFEDQLQRRVSLPAWPPRRIVSLVPSQTELLAELGLDDRVVGITKFCVHPRTWFEQKKRIGGTKTVDLQKVAGLKPDLILANKEENDQAQLEALATLFPVWISDIYTLEDALQMIERVGALTDTAAHSAALVAEIRRNFNACAAEIAPLPRRKAAYFIWRKPYMVAASHTFIDDMLHRAGFDNVFGHLTRYPAIDPDALTAADPDLILLSSEPYPFAEKHFAFFRDLCPRARVQIVDGEMFSWYGSHLLKVPAYFCGLQNLLRPF